MVFFTIEDDEVLDVRSFLRGKLQTSEVTRLFACSPVTASKHAISTKDLELLLKIPDDRWSTEDDLLGLGAEAQKLVDMASHGLLVSDDGTDPDLSELRRRAVVLDSQKWHPHAALYHFMTRSTEYEWPFSYGLVEAEAEARAQRFVAKHGPPPESFHTLPGSHRVELPLIKKEGELYELLQRRRTTRAFDTNRTMKVDDLSTLLYYTFGCHGYIYISSEVLLLHRTSPSGGSRHPVEVYPLVLRVRDLAPGIYHYNMRDHALERIRECDLGEAQDLAVEFGGGQEHLRSAHVIFVMTARFYRNHWKYQCTSKTYGVILMDIAHLSQTLYLIAADLNLGAFFSAALNSPRIDDTLGLDGYEEGALALCGAGVKVAGGDPDYGLDFRPFVPRKGDPEY